MPKHRSRPLAPLWGGRRRPIEVDPRRWADYPYFLQALEEHVGRVPKRVRVEWRPILPFVRRPLDADSDEEAARELEFVELVRRKIAAGDDVPPLLLVDGEVSDGRHRAFAARALGYAVGPVIVAES